MSVDISPEIIKSTQDSLGKFIKKPPLSDKLLRKPPFRFLHDVVTAIIRNTGFFDGLFSEEELNSENVKDRENKILFLQKVIEVVNIVTESSLSVRPSKIIAGQEPEKTNELLQKIGIALQQNLDSVKAVEVVVTGKATKKSTKISSKSIKNEQTEQPGKRITKIDSVTKVDKREKERLSLKKNPKIVRDNSISRVDNINNRKEPTPRIKQNEVLKKVKQNIDKSSKNKPLLRQPTQKQSLLNSDDEKIHNENLPENNQNKEIQNEDTSTDIPETNHIIIPEPEPQSLSDNIDDLEIKQTSKDLTGENHSESSSKSEEIKSNHSIRPQSRASRQRTSLIDSKPILTLDKKSNSGDDKSENILSSTPEENSSVGEKGDGITKSKHISRNGKDNHIKEESISKPNVSKPNGRDHSSLKRSAKMRTEPLKVTQSFSIDSKSDRESTEQKFLASNESEKRDQITRPSTSLRPPSVRPSSARPGAPRLKERNTDVIVTTSEPIVIGKVNVIVENYDNQTEDDDGSIVVIQTSLDGLPEGDSTNLKNDEITSSGHGHLVQQILETQKELTNDDTSKVEIEWEWGARREREASYKEVEIIRGGLQALSRAANPLGKLMDYVQEDVEVMRQELLQWRETRKHAAATLSQQQSQTEQYIQPLQAKLKQIEDNIEEQMELMYTVKSNIYRNAQKIRKLIDGDEIQ